MTVTFPQGTGVNIVLTSLRVESSLMPINIERPCHCHHNFDGQNLFHGHCGGQYGLIPIILVNVMFVPVTVMESLSVDGP